MTRGIKHTVDRFLSDLQAQYFIYKKASQGKKADAVQFSLRPIQLWETVFPKDDLPTVLKMLDYEHCDTRPGMGLPMAMLRKALQAKKIPKIDLSKIPKRIIWDIAIAKYFIGIKDDDVWKSGKWKGLEQL